MLKISQTEQKVYRNAGNEMKNENLGYAAHANQLIRELARGLLSSCIEYVE